MNYYIKEILSLRQRHYNTLLKQVTEEQILANLHHFNPLGSDIQPQVTAWWMTYYIDQHGDFITNGNRVHHKMARAVYESMGPKSKREVIEYIAGHEAGWPEESSAEADELNELMEYFENEQ